MTVRKFCTAKTNVAATNMAITAILTQRMLSSVVFCGSMRDPTSEGRHKSQPSPAAYP